MAWSPTGGYFKKENAQNTRIKSEVTTLCKKYQVSENQLLLAWLYKHPSKIIPVIGTTNKERIIASVKAQSINLELEDWFALMVASQGHKVP